MKETSSDDTLQVPGPDISVSERGVTLEMHANEPGFLVRWHAFVRACSLLVPDLPEEAQEWVATADEYQMGRLTLERFEAAGEQASDFYEAQKVAKSPSELSGLRVAKYCFYLPEWNWDVHIWSFFVGLEEAGIPKSRWWPFLEACYPGILGKDNRA